MDLWFIEIQENKGKKGEEKMTVINYKPFSKREPDTQYQDLLRHIVYSPDSFLAKNPHQVRGRFTNLETDNLVYSFENGFPIITEREITFWKKPITEILLFIKGVHTLQEMKDAGCDWWEEWVSPEQCQKFGLESGDLGPGSYGPNLHKLPVCEGELPKFFNQIENLVQSLKDGPGLNTHVVSTWFPPFNMQHSKLQRKVVVAPCHGTLIQCTVIENKKLVLSMVQRSGDVPVGVVSNIIQYAALTIMLAHVCGYEPYKFIHKINDAQIYENQLEKVNELLKRDPFPFPILKLSSEGQKIKNIFDFRADHFILTEYKAHPAMSIPTTL